MKLFKTHISKLSDIELIKAYQKENAQKFTAELFSRYAHLVFGVSLKYLKSEPEAKDLTQNVYTVIQKKLKTHEVTNFSSWLHQLTKNECLMELRRNKRIELVPLTENNLEEEDSHIDEKILLETKIETLLKELENLKPAQKECMKLFYLKKMSYREITSSTPYSEKEVKSYIQNGKRNLKNQLIHHAEFRTEERATRSA
ncbi:MAG TPA: RNA polymerase subunit sigma-24 [Flavobacteriales bacterium]|mgnify:FL=1|nr:RNA polymerase subunit sigma-24 [Flavobacteriales bacterium]|tara:strand:+ start:25357 stop:25956 length:600 start_codon:yes stop_codon:yes gene_type:complete